MPFGAFYYKLKDQLTYIIHATVLIDRKALLVF